mgnify:CR=1 FL=1
MAELYCEHALITLIICVYVVMFKGWLVMNAMKYAEQASELFVLSDAFVQVKALMDDDASTIDDVADIVLLDPALAGTVLKLANSAFFNYPGKLDTISKAVLVLGMQEGYNLVIAYYTTEAFKTIAANNQYLEEFWEQSVNCALLIKFIGSKLQIKNAERLFILGLLHNLGELVVQQCSPEKVLSCYCKDLSELPWQRQERILGFSYGQCGAELLKCWQLPYSLIAPIRQQDEDDFNISNQESQLLYVAKRFMLKDSLYQHLHHDLLLPNDALIRLGITEELLNDAMAYCDMERFNILSILNPNALLIY